MNRLPRQLQATTLPALYDKKSWHEETTVYYWETQKIRIIARVPFQPPNKMPYRIVLELETREKTPYRNGAKNGTHQKTQNLQQQKIANVGNEERSWSASRRRRCDQLPPTRIFRRLPLRGSLSLDTLAGSAFGAAQAFFFHLIHRSDELALRAAFSVRTDLLLERLARSGGRECLNSSSGSTPCGLNRNLISRWRWLEWPCTFSRCSAPFFLSLFGGVP